MTLSLIAAKSAKRKKGPSKQFSDAVDDESDNVEVEE